MSRCANSERRFRSGDDVGPVDHPEPRAIRLAAGDFSRCAAANQPRRRESEVAFEERRELGAWLERRSICEKLCVEALNRVVALRHASIWQGENRVRLVERDHAGKVACVDPLDEQLRQLFRTLGALGHDTPHVTGSQSPRPKGRNRVEAAVNADLTHVAARRELRARRLVLRALAKVGRELDLVVERNAEVADVRDQGLDRTRGIDRVAMHRHHAEASPLVEAECLEVVIGRDRS